MALGPGYLFPRGTRAALEALAAAGGLTTGQGYALSDEGNRLAIATGPNGFTVSALEGEVPKDLPRFIGASDGGPANAFFTMPLGQFTTIPLTQEFVSGPPTFKPATSEYLIPRSGIYDCSAKLRLKDNYGLVSHGLGIGRQNVDGPFFAWDTFPTGSIGGYDRFVLQNRRVFWLNQGDLLRIFGFVDGGTGEVNKAELIVVFIG